MTVKKIKGQTHNNKGNRGVKKGEQEISTKEQR